MKNLLLINLLALIMSSCAFHTGMMTGNASIANNNFRVAGIIDGQASTTHILGIGGLSKSALVLEAKKDMLTNYPLRKGQALANVTVDIKKTFVLFYEKTLITVSADVIDFNPMDTEEEFEDVYLLYNPNAHVGFKVGDTVYVMTNEYAMTLDKGYVSGFGQKR
ncbi:hypothetical protein KFE94_02025 [bacterium SCSIO 12643]|nr:hypothetical protein KFE94_02025 [bacterium SCSIO 12643]